MSVLKPLHLQWGAVFQPLLQFPLWPDWVHQFSEVAFDMSIALQSRYQQGTLVRLPDSSGTFNLSVLRTVPASQSSFTLYIWQAGDRPDLVAQEQLGNPSLWWAIFDINPGLIYPLNIAPGTVIRIPTAPVMGQGTLIQ